VSHRGHGSVSGIGKKFFSFQKCLDRLSDPGHWGSPLRGKAAGPQADHSPAPSTEVAHAEPHLHFPYAFMACARATLPFFHAVKLRFTGARTKSPDLIH
jgi:hypothetical protein